MGGTGLTPDKYNTIVNVFVYDREEFRRYTRVYVHAHLRTDLSYPRVFRTFVFRNFPVNYIKYTRKTIYILNTSSNDCLCNSNIRNRWFSGVLLLGLFDSERGKRFYNLNQINRVNLKSYTLAT